MTCQERIDCIKQALPLLLAVLALIAVVGLSFGIMPEYALYTDKLLGFALINLGVSQ